MREEMLHQALEQGATALTATRRLAAELRRRFDVRQMSRGLEAWPSADVLSYTDWVRRCWDLSVEEPAGSGTGTVVLSEPQALLVWERIIKASTGAAGMLHISGAVRQAREAWRWLRIWCLQPPPSAPTDPAEVAAFRGWSLTYAAELDAHGWLDPTDLPDRLTRAVREGHLELPSRLVLAGFDDIPPQQGMLLEALRARGVPVDELESTPDRESAAVRAGFSDAETEIGAAARWTRYWLELGETGRIGIVVPDLGARRSVIERIFNDVLDAGAVLPEQRASERPFNLSGGAPLADHPLISTALELLALTPGRAPLEELAVLVHSPFLAGAETERTARAMLDARLRERGDPELSPSAVERAARPVEGETAAPWHAPLLARALRDWQSVHRQSPRPPSPGRWARWFTELLGALGWPGQRTLDSVEQQALSAWNEVLAGFAGLELVAVRLTAAEALTWLRRLTAETLFQPRDAETPVQILAVLEAGGLRFDRLWVLGLHDETWPRAPSPNPFLPLEMQRRHGLPHSSLVRELEIASRETARLLTAAPEVVVSCPLREGDRELRPSPLIGALPEVRHEALPGDGTPGLWEVLATAGRTEFLADFQSPPVRRTTVTGGTALFQDQAACPFRAFAHHRLHAHELPSPETGLDATERGVLVHKALERVWDRLGDQAHLAAQDGQELTVLLEEAADAALEELHSRRAEPPGPRFLALERNRLVAALAELMAREKERSPFTVVEREARHTFHVGGIEVTGRIDRVDRVDGHGHVIIDYKTARDPRVESWLGDRPDEPQLPLYCASGAYALAGVAYARLRAGGTGFVGLAEDPALFPNARRFDVITDPDDGHPYASAAELVGHWRRVLEDLAQDFRSGRAGVTPKRGTDTCAHCDLRTLCRIDELNAWSAVAAEERDDE